ncbi:MAG: transposase [Chlorobi bacterium]|nr:transposase [Chlorobiota bacterium]
MSEKYKFQNEDGIYFITPTIVNWIDLFTRQTYSELVLDSLKYCQKEKGLVVHAWCIMPSHLHLIVSKTGSENLSAIIRDFKKFTSKAIINEIENINESRKEWLLSAFKAAGKPLKRIKKYKVWQDGNHPVELDTNKILDQRLSYLHNNPVEHGIVFRAEDYVYSSAIDYYGGKELLEIELLD